MNEVPINSNNFFGSFRNDSLVKTIETCVKSNAIFISVAIYLLIVLFFISKDPKKMFDSKYLYTVMIVLPFLIAVVYSLKKTSFASLQPEDFFKYAIFGLAVILILYIYNNVSLPSNVVSLFTGSLAIVTFLIIIVALAIIYKMFFNEIYKIPGWNGFILNIIFYIPCMLLNALEYVNKDFKQAPFAVYVLLMIEVVLLLAYIYLPKITKAVTNTIVVKDGKTVISDPMLIKHKENLISYALLNDAKPSEIVNNKFAISMWVYVVPVPPTTYPYNSDATIFEFGNYHPRLVFNGSTNKFKSFVSASNSYEFDMPLQVWNHIVYNYTKSGVDLFVNGQLVSTVNKRNQTDEALRIDDIICIGQDNGLSGGICNVTYYKTPLFQYEIKNIYNLHKNKDPPL
jgi:hypothetical protein